MEGETLITSSQLIRDLLLQAGVQASVEARAVALGAGGM
jgi:hypothetical protein